MSRYEDSCPVEAPIRAGSCQSCCATRNLPPCVAAFLGGRAALPASNVIQLRRVEVVETRKAA